MLEAERERNMEKEKMRQRKKERVYREVQSIVESVRGRESVRGSVSKG